MNAPTPAIVARPERLRLVGQRRKLLALMHQRLMIGMLAFGAVVFIIVLRLAWLAAFGDHAGRRGGLGASGPERADIVDRDGIALARTIDAWTIGLQPKKVIGDKLTLSVDGKDLLTATDGAYRYGMGGLRIASAGRMSVGRLEIEDFA